LLASQDFGAETEQMRPTVQVGDPFMGKLLMESTLEIVATGLTDAVQDLGAAGLASSIAELAYRSGVGAEIWLDDVPCRESGMTPYEIMLSETQERMLVVLAPQHMDAIEEILKHWELPYQVIGRVTETKMIRISTRLDAQAASLPPELLAGACPRKPVRAHLLEEIRRAPPSMAEFEPLNFDREWGLQVLGSPDCRSRAPIFQRYDSMILTNTVWGPSHDLAIVRVQGAPEGLAIAIAGPGRYSSLDAYSGGMAAVCRALAPLISQGASPLGLTDGINAGNPDEEDVFLQLAGLIAGIADASRAFGVPVTGGNVSLHNVTAGRPIWPTAVLGAIGRHPHPEKPVGDALTGADQDIIWINPAQSHLLGGSVFESLQRALQAYPRPLLGRVAPAFQTLSEFIRDNAGEVGVRVISDGGLFVALSKALLSSSDPECGCSVTLPHDQIANQLFSEVAGQFLLFCPSERTEQVMATLAARDIFTTKLGRSTLDSTFTIRAGRTYTYDRNELAVTYARGYRG
jgi:phosphoribosylformylglycinamidine synthase